MNGESSTTVKRIGNFSLAVTVALLATASSQASTVKPTAEAPASSSRVQASTVTTAALTHNPALSENSPNNRFVVGYANYYTNWSDYSNHSNYNNYYSNWADYANQSR